MVKRIISLTEFKNLKLFKRGKVRDIYELDNNHLLIVATDRISCFDSVLPTAIPNKGRVLNKLSFLWFNFSRDIIANHFVTADIESFSQLAEYRGILNGCSMVVKKARPIPIECVVRGYLAGSAWKEYQLQGSVAGISLPAGFREADKLPQPIFTPAHKAEYGHDKNIDVQTARHLLGNDLVQRMKDVSIQLYKAARTYAYIRGIIIADTKFEFGLINNELTLIDEVLTPDSSRFWSRKDYKPGGSQLSFDKQFVRDYLESIGWDKNPPVPPLPPEVVVKTEEKYCKVLHLLTAKSC